MGRQCRIEANKNKPRASGYAISRNLNPNLISIESCKPLGRETRKHSPQQLGKLAASLERFGFVLPILLDAKLRVVAGWGLVLAARKLGLSEVPAVCVTDLPESELRLLRLALNRVTEEAVWDREALALEFSDVMELAPQIELEISGFETGEIDLLLHRDGLDQEDDVPPIGDAASPMTRPGDLWILGEHRLLCADALQSESYERLLGADAAAMMFTDPPYNVPVAGHVSGLGKVKHAEFAMGCRREVGRN
jgi:hypothetical protein